VAIKKFTNSGNAAFYYSIESRVPQVVWIEHYYFPGWTARANGTKLKTFPQQNGLIAFEIPAGNFDLRVKLEKSWPRFGVKKLLCGRLDFLFF
jgi:hypothetical protein